jgi:hypothetical protein
MNVVPDVERASHTRCCAPSGWDGCAPACSAPSPEEEPRSGCGSSLGLFSMLPRPGGTFKRGGRPAHLVPGVASSPPGRSSQLGAWLDAAGTGLFSSPGTGSRRTPNVYAPTANGGAYPAGPVEPNVPVTGGSRVTPKNSRISSVARWEIRGQPVANPWLTNG